MPAPTTAGTQVGQTSPDGLYIWDGQTWQSLADYTSGVKSTGNVGAKPDWWDPLIPWPPLDKDSNFDSALYVKERDAYREAKDKQRKEDEKKQEPKRTLYADPNEAQRVADNYTAADTLGRKYKIAQDTATGQYYVALDTTTTTGQEWKTPRDVIEALKSSGLDPAKYDVIPTGQDTYGYKLKTGATQPVGQKMPDIQWDEKSGLGYYWDAAAGKWETVRLADFRDQIGRKALEAAANGKMEQFWAYQELLNPGLTMQRAELALKLAESPADYFKIWAIARGEMPVQAQGPFGRIAPYADWLQGMIEYLFDWTGARGIPPDDVLKGANGNAGPNGNKATQNWNEIQAVPVQPGQVPGQPGTPESRLSPAAPPTMGEPSDVEQQRQAQVSEAGATVPFGGGYPSDVAFPAQEGGGMTYTPQQPTPFTPIVRTGGTSMKGGLLTEDQGATQTPAQPDIWAQYAQSGQMPNETPEQALERQVAALYKDIPFGADDEASRLARRQAWVKENALRQQFAVSTGTQPRGRSSGPQYDVDTLGTEKSRAIVPFGAGWPTWMKDVYAGRTVEPVQRQFPAMGGPPFASPESLYNMLPSERAARQEAIKMQGIPWPDYLEQEQRATMPTGRTYRRSRYIIPFATVGRG